MKAKAPLLLKKMKTNRDIAWNEKAELKYKDKTVGATATGLGL
jgi:hypothetical protein